MVPFALGGLIAWAIASLIMLAMRDTLAAHGHESWLWICVAGFLFGFPGLAVMMRHDAGRRARRAAAAQSSDSVNGPDDGNSSTSTAPSS